MLKVHKLRSYFHLDRVVLVGDRGMLASAQIEKLKHYPGLGWISALRATDIQQLRGLYSAIIPSGQ